MNNLFSELYRLEANGRTSDNCTHCQQFKPLRIKIKQKQEV